MIGKLMHSVNSIRKPPEDATYIELRESTRAMLRVNIVLSWLVSGLGVAVCFLASIPLGALIALTAPVYCTYEFIEMLRREKQRDMEETQQNFWARRNFSARRTWNQGAGDS